MQVTLRQAAIGDEHRVAEIYLASRKRYLSYAPLAHTDEAVRAWISTQLIPTGGVTLAESREIVLGKKGTLPFFVPNMTRPATSHSFEKGKRPLFLLCWP